MGSCLPRSTLAVAGILVFYKVSVHTVLKHHQQAVLNVSQKQQKLLKGYTFHLFVTV